jgi:hypothetical protein
MSYEPLYRAIPEPRGCGDRTPGGLYIESGLGLGGVPLEHFLVDPPLPVPEGLNLINKPQIVVDTETGVAHLWLWIGAEWYPYVPDYLEECMPPHELVVTARGLIPIETVREGDEVLTDHGRFRPVIATMARPYTGELLSVVTAYWQFPLRVTPEHPVLRAKVLRGRARKKAEGLDGEHILERTYIPARELQVGEYLCCPIRQEEQDVETVTMSYLKEYTTTFRNALRTPDLVMQARTLRASERDMPRGDPLRTLLQQLSERDHWSLADVRTTCADLYRHEKGLIRALTRLCTKGCLQRLQRGEYVVTDEGRHIASLPSLSYEALGQALGISRNTAMRAIHPPQRRHAKSIEIAVSADLMRVIGYYLAEGSVANTTQNGRRDYYDVVEFSFGRVDDLEEQQLAEDTALAVRGLGFSAGVQQKRGYWRVAAYSRFLAHWLAQEFGTGAHEKSIPAWVLALPAAKLHPLFDAYIAGDGYVHGTQRQGTTVSLQLAYAISQVAQRCGFRASVGQYRPEAPYRVTCYVGTGTDVFSDDDYLYMPIRSIARIGYAGTVHNLAVAEDESYCVGYHAVHNCRRLGASRKLNPQMDLSQLTPGSRMILVHPAARNTRWLEQQPPHECAKRVPDHALEREVQPRAPVMPPSTPTLAPNSPLDKENPVPIPIPFGWRWPEPHLGPCLFKTFELIPQEASADANQPTEIAGRVWYARRIGSTTYFYEPSGESAEGLEPGVFAALPITGFALIRHPDGSVNEPVRRKLEAADLPFYTSDC